jgi:hypothetical protein
MTAWSPTERAILDEAEAADWTTADVARATGRTLASVYEAARRRGITLRRQTPGIHILRPHLIIRLPERTRDRLAAHAAAMGLRPAELAEQLISTIAEDDIYDAVLDGGGA